MDHQKDERSLTKYDKISEPSRYLKSNPVHAFTWKVIVTAPINDHMRKNLEPSFVALSRPSLNEQNSRNSLKVVSAIFLLVCFSV